MSSLPKFLQKMYKPMAIGLAGLVTVSVAARGFYLNSIKAQAGQETLPGIEKLRNEFIEEEKTYRILEIQPNVTAAEVGFYVGGQEPFDSLLQDDNSWISWQEKLASLPTKEERENFMQQLEQEAQMVLNALEGNGQPPFSLSSPFYEEIENIASLEEAEAAGVSSFTGTAGTMRGYFLAAEDETAKWQVVFEPFVDSNISLEEINCGIDTPYYMAVFDADAPLTQEQIRQMVEMGSADFLYQYEGGYLYFSGTVQEVWESIEKDISVGGLDVTGGDAGVSSGDVNHTTTYYNATFRLINDGNTGNAETSDVCVYVANTKNAKYVGSGGNYHLVNTEEGTAAGAVYEIEGETIYYKGGILNAEVFRSGVLGLDEAEWDKFHVQIDTMTPGMLNELTAEELQVYDMVYYGTGALEQAVSGAEYTYTEDFSVEIAEILTDYIARKQIPCIVDSVQDSMDDDGEYVSGNVWVYDSGNGLFVKNGFVETTYDNEKIEDGFQAVLEEIQVENENRRSDANVDIYLSEEITDAAVWRFILNYRNHSFEVEKSSLKVLRIEPACTDTGEISFKTLLSEVSGVAVENINVDWIPVTEFIGIIDDLNAKYDMIYIGSLTDEFSAEWNREGNDITAEKYNALLDYMAASYPIVVADDLLMLDTTGSDATYVVNGDKVASASYLYEFLDKTKESGNVFRLSEVDSANRDFLFCLNRPRLSMSNLTLLGTEDYKVGSDVRVMKKAEDEKYYLNFQFTIQEQGAIGDADYTCKLYLDSNADGKFSTKNEEFEDLIVTNGSGQRVDVNCLKAGEIYTVTRPMPDDFDDCITWKVAVWQQNDPYIRTEEKGYVCLQKETEDAERIKILQIYFPSDNGNIILQDQIGTVVQSKDDIYSYSGDSGQANSCFYKMAREISTEYILDVTSVSWSDFDQFATGQSSVIPGTNILDLSNFDMLMVGLSDISDSNLSNVWGEETVAVIKEFADSGRAVLLTHDCYFDNGINIQTAFKINEGQITNYPFEIMEEELPIATTHSPYYALDMSSDSDNDGQTDLAVWFCLAAGENNTNAAFSCDVRNNYYIYSKGNITYTGIGHSGTVTEGEAKLFFNTLIAAYQTGTKSPKVNVLDVNGEPCDYLYGFYDNANAVWQDDAVEIYFTLQDRNRKVGTKTLEVEYWIEDNRNGTEEVVKSLYLSKITDADNVVTYDPDGREVTNLSSLRPGVGYTIHIPLTYFEPNEINGNEIVFVLRARTAINSKQGPDQTEKLTTSWGVGQLRYLNCELFELD